MENIKNKKWYDNVLWICIISYAILIISEIIGGLFIVCSIIGIFVGGFKIMKSHRYYGNSYEGYLFLVASISCFVTSALFFAYGEIIILNQKILNLLKDKLS